MSYPTHFYTDTLPLQHIPVLTPTAMEQEIQKLCAKGWRLALLCGIEQKYFIEQKNCINSEYGVGLLALLIPYAGQEYIALRTDALTEYTSFTLTCPQAHWFEREIYEDWGIEPLGHPWLKPIRFTPPKKASTSTPERPLPADTQYFQVQGAEVHEVAVGPVHAGVIEPGHFRFQCYGEDVMHLEISLGFQHRGVEQILPQCANPTHALRLIECVAGDTSIAHATAYALLWERLHKSPASARGTYLRAIALELERLACHVGDLGALGGDTGFLPTSAWCGRIRGDFLNMTALLCGNRFGRNMVCLGGTHYDMDATLQKELLRRLKATWRDARGAVDIMLRDKGVLDRFSNTGTLSYNLAKDIGLVGVAAKACGLMLDARHSMPNLTPAVTLPPIRTAHSNDVLGRALVRSAEVDDSVQIIEKLSHTLPDGTCANFSPTIKNTSPPSLVIAAVEGWRGTVFHTALSNTEGQIAWHKMVDPSFHNWIGLALALRNQEISDFPLCNKSFNLSYCGHDL